IKFWSSHRRFVFCLLSLFFYHRFVFIPLDTYTPSDRHGRRAEAQHLRTRQRDRLAPHVALGHPQPLCRRRVTTNIIAPIHLPHTHHSCPPPPDLGAPASKQRAAALCAALARREYNG